MGRKTKIDEELILKFAELIASGITRKSAAHGAGISEASLYNWIERGKKAMIECEKDHTPVEEHKDYIYIEFLEQLQVTEAELERKLVGEVMDEPQGARWLLGHSPRFREKYGNSIEVNLHGENNPMQYEIAWPDQHQQIESGDDDPIEEIE